MQKSKKTKTKGHPPPQHLFPSKLKPTLSLSADKTQTFYLLPETARVNSINPLLSAAVHFACCWSFLQTSSDLQRSWEFLSVPRTYAGKKSERGEKLPPVVKVEFRVLSPLFSIEQLQNLCNFVYVILPQLTCKNKNYTEKDVKLHVYIKLV